MREIYSIRDLLTICDELRKVYTFVGDVNTEVTGFSDPGEYREHTAVWLGAVRYLKVPREQYSNVALLFCTPQLLGKEQFPNRLECDDPRNTFMEIVETVAETATKQHLIATTAVIAKTAKIGNNVAIGHYSIIEDNVEIGNNTIIGHGTVIHEGTVIGDNCLIEDNTVSR